VVEIGIRIHIYGNFRSPEIAESLFPPQTAHMIFSCSVIFVALLCTRNVLPRWRRRCPPAFQVVDIVQPWLSLMYSLMRSIGSTAGLLGAGATAGAIQPQRQATPGSWRGRAARWHTLYEWWCAGLWSRWCNEDAVRIFREIHLSSRPSSRFNVSSPSSKFETRISLPAER
jgi:hypothetical protein